MTPEKHDCYNVLRLCLRANKSFCSIENLIMYLFEVGDDCFELTMGQDEYVLDPACV